MLRKPAVYSISHAEYGSGGVVVHVSRIVSDSTRVRANSGIDQIGLNVTDP